MTDRRSIGDYRRRVADLYAEVRRVGVSEAAWRRWRRNRDELFRTHPDSPVRPVPDDWPGQPFWDYDPTWNVLGEVVVDSEGPAIEITTESGERERFDRAGAVRFARNGVTHELPLYWARSYGGGWFLPFRDGTSGGATFGSGRYLLDQAKSAHLGEVDGLLVLDFNFAYHPSCVWGDWLCPLPRPESRLAVEVRAGERAAL